MAAASKRIRVLIGKPGLDGHDRGAKLVAKVLRDAGMEVIYTGRHQTVNQIVTAAVQEDVDVVGMSILSGAHMFYTDQLIKQLAEEKLGDRMVLVGGNIPVDDVPTLKEMGVTEVFSTDTRFENIISFIENRFANA